ncbi:MAG: hypothetical protein ACPHID_08050 [Thermoplasmatota archaeon]
MELDAPPEESLHQVFSLPRPAGDALDDATTYLQGVGFVAPKLRGRVERFGDSLAVHHGRIETRIRVESEGDASRVEVTRKGQAPLEDTRRWMLVLGLGGFLLAWGVTFFNERGAGLHPMLVIGLFLVGLVLTVAVLFVADRSMERRSEAIVLALEDAMHGNPREVLDVQILEFDRSTSLANGFIFYCAGLVVAFFAYAVVFSDGIRAAIDVDAALTTMQFVFLFPILPALAFAGIYYLFQRRGHQARLARL